MATSPTQLGSVLTRVSHWLVLSGDTINGFQSREPIVDLTNLGKEIGELADCPLLPQRNRMFLCRMAKVASSLPDGFAYPGLRLDDDIVDDIQVADNSHLTGNEIPLAKPSASGDSDLRSDHSISANDNVVGNMHEVIDLDAYANLSPPHCGPIDCRARTDFNIISQDNDPDVRHLLPGPV